MNNNSELAEILRRNPELEVIDDYTAVRDEPSPVYESGVDIILATGNSGSFQSGDGWVKIVLAGERPQTWNKFWAGAHWQERRRYKAAAVESISNVLPPEFTPFTDPVRVQYDVYYNGRPQDWSNVCIKPYEDALRGTVVVDDDIRYILGGTVNVHIDKKNPRIEILFTVASA